MCNCLQFSRYFWLSNFNGNFSTVKFVHPSFIHELLLLLVLMVVLYFHSTVNNNVRESNDKRESGRGERKER
jgi:prolipoprotein diacylglyceryltransferase